MLLSDNISCIFQVPTIKTLNSLEEVKDPSFPFIEEATQAFCKAMKGYVLTYGEGLIRRALIRLA